MYKEARKEQLKTYGVIQEAQRGSGPLGTTRNWQWLTRRGSDRHTSFSRTVEPPGVHLMLVKQHSKRSPAVFTLTVFLGNIFVLTPILLLTKFFMYVVFFFSHCGFDVYFGYGSYQLSIFYMYTYSIFKWPKLFQGIIYENPKTSNNIWLQSCYSNSGKHDSIYYPQQLRGLLKFRGGSNRFSIMVLVLVYLGCNSQ